MCIKKVCAKIKMLRTTYAEQMYAEMQKYPVRLYMPSQDDRIRAEHAAAQAKITKTVYLNAGDAAPKQEICRMVVYEDMQPKYIQTCKYFNDCDNTDCPHYHDLARYMHVDEKLTLAKIMFERNGTKQR